MSLPASELQQRAQEAAQQLPSAPLKVLPEEDLHLQHFEVAIAVNLDFPYRYTQDVLWLEIIAADAREAVRATTMWVLQAPQTFESLGLVRPAGAHETTLGFDHHDEPLLVFWNAPVRDDTPPAAVIRHPVTGLRLGFVALPSAEEEWLPDAARGRFRLLTRKPTPSSDPAGLAPLVWPADRFSEALARSPKSE